MPTPPRAARKIPLLPVVIGAAAVLALGLALLYLNRPPAKTAAGPASSEAKAYLQYLELKDVTMKASENFMQQRVVEVEGSIGNKGPRALQSIVVYCLFYGVDGHEIYRERVPVLPARSPALKPGEMRSFRLPFDGVPQGWNQVVPKMVIAQINFAS